MDENDPLWQLVLTKICNGDRDRATKLINNPDSLTKYPEVVALIEIMPSAAMEEEEDWEKADSADALAGKVEDMKIDQAASAKASGAPSKKQSAAMVVDAVEGDPREHLNLIFIGHVNAGKSTLSGNILYLTDNVDKRTIKKYEAEAKEHNRESWFLAFIMDTNYNLDPRR